MPQRVTLTRRVRFSAAHRYYREDWDEQRNRAVFGDNVKLHGHNYILEAAVEGTIDATTGMACDITSLDAALGEIASQLGYRDLSVADELDGAVPTTENLAAYVWSRLSGRTGDARLVRVRLFESPELYVEITDDGSSASGGKV